MTQPASAWQPIETVPINQDILAGWPPGFSTRVDIGMCMDDGDGPIWDWDSPPTHWQPLPEPPDELLQDR